MTNRERYIQAATGHRAKGAAEYLAYLQNGKIPPPLRAIAAKCFECQAWYTDGLVSCEDRDCPLFPHHPYNPGRVKKRRELTDEQRLALSERFKKTRAKF